MTISKDEFYAGLCAEFAIILNRYKPNQQEILLQQQSQIILQCIFNCGLSNKKTLTAEETSLARAELANTIFGIGDFPIIFTRPSWIELTAIEIEQGTYQLTEKIRAYLRYILNGESSSTKQYDLAGLNYQNEQTNQIGRQIFQHAFVNLFLYLHDADLSEQQLELINNAISGLLSHYVLMRPDPSDVLQLPQLINGQWQLEKYTIRPIELVGADKKFVLEKEAVYAYGFVPENAALNPYLVFESATGKLGKMASFIPGYTVGEKLYLAGQENISNWLENEMVGREKLIVTGQGLGGTLALLTVLNRPKQVARVDAFTATAIKRATLNRDEFRVWDACFENQRPEVNVFINKHDPVSLAENYWASSWNLYRLTPRIKSTASGQAADFFLAHSHLLLTQHEVLIVKVDPKQESEFPFRAARAGAKAAADPFVLFTQGTLGSVSSAGPRLAKATRKPRVMIPNRRLTAQVVMDNLRQQKEILQGKVGKVGSKDDLTNGRIDLLEGIIAAINMSNKTNDLMLILIARLKENNKALGERYNKKRRLGTTHDFLQKLHEELRRQIERNPINYAELANRARNDWSFTERLDNFVTAQSSGFKESLGDESKIEWLVFINSLRSIEELAELFEKISYGKDQNQVDSSTPLHKVRLERNKSRGTKENSYGATNRSKWIAQQIKAALKEQLFRMNCQITTPQHDLCYGVFSTNVGRKEKAITNSARWYAGVKITLVEADRVRADSGEVPLSNLDRLFGGGSYYNPEADAEQAYFVGQQRGHL